MTCRDKYFKVHFTHNIFFSLEQAVRILLIDAVLVRKKLRIAASTHRVTKHDESKREARKGGQTFGQIQTTPRLALSAVLSSPLRARFSVVSWLVPNLYLFPYKRGLGMRKGYGFRRSLRT